MCIGSTKLETYARHGQGREWLVRGMVYVWDGVEVADLDDPEDVLLVVSRPGLGPAILAPRSDFVPLEEVPAFFEHDEPAAAAM
jgi:hypothetical protein